MSKHRDLLLLAKQLPRSPIHSFHRYFGKLIPAIVSFAVREFTSPGDVVLDPFCGSGTTLVEALLHGRQAIGVEINPLACLVSRVKTTVVEPRELSQVILTVRNRAEKLQGENGLPVPYCVNMGHWFSTEIQKKLAALRLAILELEDLESRDFCLAVLSAIIRNVSNADPQHIFPGYSKRLRGLDNKGAVRPDPLALFYTAAQKRLESLSDYRKKPMPHSSVINGDAKDLATLIRGPVELIVTNPPYISSIRYLETMKLEMSWLGMLPGPTAYVDLDRRCLGSERCYKAEYGALPPTGWEEIDCLTSKLYADGHKKMSYTVSRFFTNTEQVILGMAAVLRTGGHLVVKISDSHVRGLDIPTHLFFIAMAQSAGLCKIDSFPDAIGGRSLMTRRNSYSGMIEHDWILIFRKE